MERLKLAAEDRQVGKKGLGELRRKGLVPAILYGRGSDSKGLALNAKELAQALGGSAGMNAVIELHLKNGKGADLVMIKDYQINVLSHKLIHVDLLKIDMTKKVTVKVPVHVTGKSVGVVAGGVMELIAREIEFKCLPTNIPSSISVDITALNIGDSIHLGSLTLPEGVEVAQDAGATIVSIVAPRADEPEAVVAAAEVSAGAVPVVAKEKEEEGTPEAKAGEAAAPKGEKKG